MQLLHDRCATVSPTRLATPNRRLGRFMVLGALGAASLAFTACGSTRAVTILNTEKIERAIEESSLAQRGKHVQVNCPSGIHQQRRLVFACTASTRHASTRFVVTQLDDSGHVHYEAR